MPKSANALVKPALLVWARTEAHLGIEEAAKRARVSPERLESWENGNSTPTVKQLRTLAKVYRQNFAAFYLSKPPESKRPNLRDYRRLPGVSYDSLSSALVFEIRDAMERREIALELYTEAGEDLPVFSESTTLSEDPEAVGGRIRSSLGINMAQQSRFRKGRTAFNSWRQAVEGVGVLVFQATQIPVEEMRGFSLSDRPLPAIIVNRKDAYVARCFTLLHEFTHLMLHASGLCDLQDSIHRSPEDQRIEVFCNHVAASTLVPQQSLVNQDIVISHGRDPNWSGAELSELARRYVVSREVMVRRLLTLGLTDLEFYQGQREKLLDEFESRPKSTRGFLPPSTNVVSAAGKPFVRLVLNAMYSNQITANDVSSYLGIRLKHINRIEQSVWETRQGI
jgi:Zn-dependent peptidase ImmA (M78 family)/transcriptional regulator with XRE-family HTH domain